MVEYFKRDSLLGRSSFLLFLYIFHAAVSGVEDVKIMKVIPVIVMCRCLVKRETR